MNQQRRTVRLVACVVVSRLFVSSVSLNQSTVIEGNFPLSREEQRFLDDRWNLIQKYSSRPTPETYLRFVKDHRKCAEILSKLMDVVSEPINPQTQQPLHDDAVTLFCQFWDSGKFKEAFQVGKFLDKRYCRHQLSQFEAIGNGALLGYKFSLQTHREFRSGINRYIEGLCPGVKLMAREPAIIKDQYGIARAFVGFACCEDPEMEIVPKVYIALTGTRSDSQVSYTMIAKQFLGANLDYMPQQHPSGGWSTHRGFQTMSDFLEKKIVEEIQRFRASLPDHQRDQKIEVCISGHGTGAAIANIMALSLGTQPWCRTCIAYTLATPCAFRGAVTIPENVLIQNFVHEFDVVSTDVLFHGIGETYVLNDPLDERRLRSPLDLHKTFFEEFFRAGTFSFEKGERSIVRTVTYNHKGDLVTDLSPTS
jgi:hypothetical protein